jgi:tetratricopeptide (TPR) repeat protein
MKLTGLFAVIFLFSEVLLPKTLVLPFQVDTQNHASYQWLGKAVSFYLISGLSLNLLDVTTEEETQFLLKQDLVLFPFGITKATAITLARQNQADRLLWGKILNNAGDATGSVTIKMFLIDIAGQSQIYLPLIKGDSKDLFLIQNELLRHAAKALGKKESEIEYPDPGLPPVDYEKFIKSLLLSDGEKKIEWLLPLTQRNERSDFVNWEMAKALFDKSDYAHTDIYLKKISESRLFGDRRNFLLALNDSYAGKPDLALERFLELRGKKVFDAETENNLGVLYLQKKNFPEAEACLDRALRLRKNPGISFNYIQLLVLMGKDRQADAQLTQALFQFPDDRHLLQSLFLLISRHPDKELLFQVFRTHTPIALVSEEELKLEPVMQNPFGIRHPDAPPQDAKPFFTEARSMFLEDDVNGAQEKIEQAMEINPFMAENHQLLSMIYLKKGELPKAEAYGLSSLFLKESADVYQLLVKIYQASNEPEKIRKIRLREQNKDRTPGGS